MSSGLTELADLVVEDGTGLVGANSYSDIATATAYCTLRNGSDPYDRWLNTDESNRVSALIFATQYLHRRWEFKGDVFNDGDGDPAAAQALHFPVEFPVYDGRGIEISETVPAQIVDATIEYACRAINSGTLQAEPLQDDLATQDDAGREIARKREVVGPIEEETWFETQGSRRWVDYGTADQIIRRSGLAGSGGGSGLLRA